MSTRKALLVAAITLLALLSIAEFIGKEFEARLSHQIPLVLSLAGLLRESKSREPARSEPRFESRPASVTLASVYEGLFAGVAGGAFAGLAIGTPYYLEMRRYPTAGPPEGFATVVLEIAVFTCAVGAALGVLYNLLLAWYRDADGRRRTLAACRTFRT